MTCRQIPPTCGQHMILTEYRRANEDSVLAIQIFDQKKFKKRDQGFLGVINVRVGDVIDLDMGGDGKRYAHRMQMDTLTKYQKC